MRGSGVVGLVLVCMLAGCTGSLPAPEMGADAGWDGDPDNHFRQHNLTVFIDAGGDDTRDYDALVRAVLDYWERNAEEYAGFPIAYELTENESKADLTVAFVPVVDNCGTEGHAAGCAPVLTDHQQINNPVRVRVRTGLSDESTIRVLTHEVGHTLGLTHEDAPQEVMAASATLTTQPLPNATDRELPWGVPELAVYVDYGSVSDANREEAERQLAATLDYFARGADGTVPSNVSFVEATNRSTADVVILFRKEPPCTAQGSCGHLEGTDPDSDGAIETYTRLTITVGTDGLAPEKYGWHAGFWLARGFGLRGDELPEPLRSDDPRVRSSEWWAA